MVSNDKYFIERFQRDVIDSPRALPSRYFNPYLKVPLGFIPPVRTYAHTLKHPYEIIHYYYKIDDIAETVFQRTSMLGKFRSNDKGEHQLDVMALTPDERADFEGYCKKAATDVYDKLIGFSVPGRRCFLYDEDVYVPMKENEGVPFAFSETFAAETYRHDTWTLTVPSPDAGKKMDAAQLLMLLDKSLTLTTALTALSGNYAKAMKKREAEKWERRFLEKGIIAYISPNNTGAETRNLKYLSISIEVETPSVLDKTMAVEVCVSYSYRIRQWNGEPTVRSSFIRQRVNASTIAFSGTGASISVPLPITLDTTESALPGLPTEEIIDLEYYKIERCAVVKLLPEKLDRGDAVIYTDSEDKVSFYAAVRPTDTSAPIDDEALFAPTYDYRHTVHFIVKKPLHVHDDSVAQVDTTILEAMVYRVMYYWSQVTAPQDNKFYLDEWQNCINDLKCRLNSSGPISITSHPY